MNVYLVPAGQARHELYCEISAPPPSVDGRAGTLRGRLAEGFRRMVEEGDAERYGEGGADEPRGRLRRSITRRVAEAVAEQRLLWSLRHEPAAHLIYPDDLTEAKAFATSRALIAADYVKHRRWCAIDVIIAGITGPLFFFVPGPNIVSWYFGFRAVGHYLALRGASEGLSTIAWTSAPAGALTDLRAALALDGEKRSRRVDEISTTLGLSRLPIFVARVAA